MNATIVAFLVFGACFGLATYSRRHLFSEGPTQRNGGAPLGPMDGRLMWTLICTFLWPVMALTGVHTLLLLRRRKAVAARSRDIGPK